MRYCITTTAGTHIVILDIEAEGTLYLGRIERAGDDRGVLNTRWANHYTEGAARAVAAQYPRAIVAPLPITMRLGGGRLS